MRFVFFPLSITSSWGNGHATCYRGLGKALTLAGHDVLFLERDQPWYAAHRDFSDGASGRVELYHDIADLGRAYAGEVADADCVIMGSYVPEGIAVSRWISETASGLFAFYDIDTPITLSALRGRSCAYLSKEAILLYDFYLSFTGGPILQCLEKEFGARRPVAFHCFVDSEEYWPETLEERWRLGYLGTYSEDRQEPLQRMLLAPAHSTPGAKFAVAGAHTGTIDWPLNVERVEHVPPARHRAFYRAQRFTLNITRKDMIRAGWSPSVRLFEAAACGVPVITDEWDGIEDFFTPGSEILVARNSADVLAILNDLPESQRLGIALKARSRVLGEHTAECRAAQLVSLIMENQPARANVGNPQGVAA